MTLTVLNLWSEKTPLELAAVLEHNQLHIFNLSYAAA